jgi:hypothetical protein
MTEEILQFHYKESLAILLLVYSADEGNTLHEYDASRMCYVILLSSQYGVV